MTQQPDLKAAGRIVTRTLADGSTVELVEKLLDADYDAETKTVTVIASDETLDRMRDRIDPKGWDLKNYKRNPVVLIDHTHSIHALVGKADVAVEGDKLKATITLADPERVPAAGLVQALLDAGALRSVSVGFQAKKTELIRDDNNEPTGGFHFRKQELLEISFVPVPANPNALLSKDAPCDALPEDTPAPAAEDASDVLNKLKLLCAAWRVKWN